MSIQAKKTLSFILFSVIIIKRLEMTGKIKVRIILAVIVITAVLLSIGISLWFNITWFNNLGYIKVFSRILWAKVALWCIFFAIFFVFAGTNLLIAFRMGKIDTLQIKQAGMPEEITKKSGIVLSVLTLLLLAFFMANSALRNWEIVLKFFHQTSFNLKDPIYGKDISFYVFSLPFYLFLKTWALTSVILTALMVGSLYFLSGHVKSEDRKFIFSSHAKKHILFFLIILTLFIAWHYWLKRYMLLFANKGLIFGANFTDVKIVRPAYFGMIIISILAAFLTSISLLKDSFRQMFIGYGILIGAVVIFLGITPWIIQGFVVKPNELIKELPYIKDNILFTREGYNLNKITKKAFPVQASLTADDFGSGSKITNHIRLWDRRPLEATFSQLQEFRLYYDFSSVNTDRYLFDNSYRQVMISAREINDTNFPPSAQTWVNLKLQYTHGYGVVMSPVDKIGQEGLPEFIIKDIPPKISVPLTIDRPEIYYGQQTSSYVIGNTKLPEFDYPKGNDNVTAHYKGSGGIQIKNGWRKFLFALHFLSTDILFTNYITPDSRMMIYRNIQQRVPTIAPFLTYDQSPYVVVSGGRLYWIVDAYTKTNKFPYSNANQSGFNYIRNSVKITIDAYNGDVNFYIVDKKDPLIETYKKIFPSLFKDFSDMPEDLKLHVRYPKDMFTVQANMYTVYHMTDPQVFYNKEDKWAIPSEIYGEEQTVMNPYYAIVKFPGNKERYEYVLMMPFTPLNKNNMVSWVAAMSDQENYGNLVEYQFPKEKLIFGPMQIESRIDQNTEISQLFTLWGQKGSSVIRGNLLVYPIKNSILYVEPIYLRAETSQLPELKRIVVAYQDKIGVGANLGDALSEIFGGTNAQTQAPSAVNASQPLKTLNIQGLINKAVVNFNTAQEKLRAGDFAGYGEYNKRLQKSLMDLAGSVKSD